VNRNLERMFELRPHGGLTSDLKSPLRAIRSDRVRARRVPPMWIRERVLGPRDWHAAIQQLPVAWFRAVASVVAYGLATNRTDSEVMAPSLPVTSRRILTSFVFGP